MIKMMHLAVQEGIKSVGVGKKGSRPLNSELIPLILNELRTNKVPDIMKGAFFAGLSMKGPEAQEWAFDQYFPNPTLGDKRRLVEMLTIDVPDDIRHLCFLLLDQQNLTVTQAQKLGRFLMGQGSGEAARGLAATVLRVRYESADEYQGLLQGMAETYEEPYRVPTPPGRPIISIAEPFDGVDHSNLITPLLTQYIQSLDYRVVSLVGRNSGPKFGNNLLDIARQLKATFLRSNHEFIDASPAFGYYLNQQDLSAAVDAWVERRHQIIKRPFLATLERFVNPCEAHILVASAFHPPYGDKMLTICERSNLPGAIIVRNGLEGTIAFPLMRSPKVLCTARQNNGQYIRHEFVFEPQEYLVETISKEERLDNPSLEFNVNLINEYSREKKTGYALFDRRVAFTCAGLHKAIEWIEFQLSKSR